MTPETICAETNTKVFEYKWQSQYEQSNQRSFVSSLKGGVPLGPAFGPVFYGDHGLIMVIPVPAKWRVLRVARVAWRAVAMPAI